MHTIMLGCMTFTIVSVSRCLQFTRQTFPLLQKMPCGSGAALKSMYVTLRYNRSEYLLYKGSSWIKCAATSNKWIFCSRSCSQSSNSCKKPPRMRKKAIDDNKSCKCLNKPLSFDDYDEVRRLGVDSTNGRYGEVNLWRCKRCGRYWLRYQVEYEAFTGSGRYFMGLITPEKAEILAPDEVVPYLNQLEWHLYGGSYFFGKKGRTTGKVDVDAK